MSVPSARKNEREGNKVQKLSGSIKWEHNPCPRFAWNETNGGYRSKITDHFYDVQSTLIIEETGPEKNRARRIERRAGLKRVEGRTVIGND